MSEEGRAKQPGVKTSEFWVTAAAFAANAATSLGFVEPANDTQHLTSVAASAVVALVLGVQYLHGRTSLKRGDRKDMLREAAEMQSRLREVFNELWQNPGNSQTAGGK